MNKIKKILSVLICSFPILIPYKKSYAMPQPTQYNYHNADFYMDEMRHHVLSNRAIVLRGHHNQKITIGNEKVAKKYRSSAMQGYRLHLHHVLFKAMRNTFPAIPYVCMQTPVNHHKRYHRDRQQTDINYSSFTNMTEYFNNLRSSILVISENRDDDYSNICIQAADLAIRFQEYWIANRYSWLYSVENSTYLLLAQRLIAKDCFPNQVLANKYICQNKIQYIKEELALSHFIRDRINLNEPGGHLKNAMRGRITSLNTYTVNFNEITSQQAFHMANQRYADSERFYNPIANIQNLDGELSDASSLDN